MNEALFDQLVASVREGGAILRGEQLPSRSFSFSAPEVKSIRARYGLSQREFAARLGISMATLRNWEQGRRQPEGPARVLLEIAARHPRILADLVGTPPAMGPARQRRHTIRYKRRVPSSAARAPRPAGQ
jgi:putative transcriptional regulator